MNKENNTTENKNIIFKLVQKIFNKKYMLAMAVMIGCAIITIVGFAKFNTASQYEPTEKEVVDKAVAALATPTYIEDSTIPEAGRSVSFKPNTKEPTYEDVTHSVTYDPSEMCFIGDSRTVGMKQAVLTDAHFICKEGVGLDWLKSDAIPKLKEIQNDVKLCVILLGINDLYHKNAYVQEMNALTEQFAEIRFVFVTVSPVNEELCEDISNLDIEEFNEVVASGLNNQWCVVDLYTYLAANGFATEDGIHYTQTVSGMTFAWVIEQISEFQITETIEVSNE